MSFGERERERERGNNRGEEFEFVYRGVERKRLLFLTYKC